MEPTLFFYLYLRHKTGRQTSNYLRIPLNSHGSHANMKSSFLNYNTDMQAFKHTITVPLFSPLSLSGSLSGVSSVWPIVLSWLVYDAGLRDRAHASYKWLLIQAARQNMAKLSSEWLAQIWDVSFMFNTTGRGGFSCKFYLFVESLWGSWLHSGWQCVGRRLRWMDIAWGERLSDVNPAWGKCLCDVTLQHAAKHVEAPRVG